MPNRRPSELPPPGPGGVRGAVFSDFDETYLAHEPSREQRRDLAELEDLLLDLAGQGRLLFGWVTGSSLSSVMSRVERHRLGVLPHFLASSLGTELTFFTGGQGRRDPQWHRRMRESGYTKQAVTRVVEELHEADVVLRPQGGQERTEFLDSYYYTSLGERPDAVAVRNIELACRRHGLGVSVSRCNPKAGDPDGSFDVDFIPRGGGKRAVVDHLCHRFAPVRSLAFGDSGNDIEMLRGVHRGLLVANATADARVAHPHVASHSYAAAIRHTIQSIPELFSEGGTHSCG
ncbi:HAD-IIB family hydrolase [Streptomyces sp. NPDC020898]|uniref:HAD-IIB family hydrolase n=1 Tax=Streptomyces sp. NPDC020898 TaxID=3365101 RepID=UPI003793A709